jgi:hypothetical protein
MRAAARGKATRCAQPRGARRHGACGDDGPATWSGREAMRRVRVQGHGDAGHVSVVMLFHPWRSSSPSWSVVGPGGPSRERADLLVGKEGAAW